MSCNNLIQQIKRFTTKKNLNDSLNLNSSTDSLNLNNKLHKNNLTNYNRNNTILKSKSLLNTNLSTIKKEKDTSNLFTDNEIVKDKIDSEEDNQEKLVIAKMKNKKSKRNSNLNEKPKDVINNNKDKLEFKNYDDDDYLNADVNNQDISLSEDKHAKLNRNSIKESPKIDAKLNNVLIKESNDNKINIKNNSEEKNVQINQKNSQINPLKIKNKDKNIFKVQEGNTKLKIKRPSQNKENEKPSQSTYIKSYKRKFSQYQQENISDYENDTQNKRSKRLTGSKKISITESELMKRSYQYMHLLEQQKIEIENQKAKSFGTDGRYSRRNRAPKLNHIAGDRVVYQLGWNSELKMFVPEIKYIFTNSINLENFRDQFEVKKSKKKKLVKGLKKTSDENDLIKEEDNDNDSNSDEKDDLPEKFSEEENDGDNIIRVYPNSKKKEVKNMNVEIKGKVIEANGNNLFIINGKKLTNLKKNDSFDIPPLAKFQILNYSNNDLRIMLRIIEDN